MVRFSCVEKYRDRNGNIVGYLLMNLACNELKRQVRADELKKLIKHGKIEVINLTLTSDNRLVDKGNIRENNKINNNNWFYDQYRDPIIHGNAQTYQEGTSRVTDEYTRKQNETKRKQSFNKTMNFMKDIGSILFTGKTLEEREKEKARYKNNKVSWEHNHHEYDEFTGRVIDDDDDDGDFDGDFDD